MRKALLGFGILACWVLSLMLPVADSLTSSGVRTENGWTILKTGMAGPLIFQFGWFANCLLIPALGVAAGQYGQVRRARLTLAVLLALLVLNSAFWRTMPDDAGENAIVAFRAGYWLWMTAIAATSGWLLATYATIIRSGDGDGYRGLI